MDHYFWSELHQNLWRSEDTIDFLRLEHVSSIDFLCLEHVSSIDFLCLEQLFCVWNDCPQHKKSVQDTENLWRTHVLQRNVSSIEFGAIQTKNNGLLLVELCVHG